MGTLPIVSRFIARRLITTLVVLAIVSLMSFSIMHLVPGDPAAVLAGVGADADQIATIRTEFGLDQPLPVQMLRWYAGLAHGDLGQSVLLGTSVVSAIESRLPVTLSLTIFALIVSVVLGLLAGIVAALNRNRWPDRLVMGVSVLGISMPSFWLGLLLILLFAVQWRLLPAGGYVAFSQNPLGWLESIVLPGIAMAMLQVGYLARVTRAALVDVLDQDFIRTADAKGLPRWMVIGKHALGNALLPVLTVVGIVVSLMLSGSVVIETVFSLPGLGRLMATAILSRDYPVIQGTLLLTAAVFTLVNLGVDLLYMLVDPRISYE